MMNNNKDYYIVYASDDNFAEILGVSMVSLFENNKDATNITIVILDTEISKINKENLEAICVQYNRPLPIWVTAINIEDKLKISVDSDRGSFSQYARLFVSSLLPDDVERALYLDCDIIINRSIEELWNLDLQGKTIAALMDAFSKYYRINIDLNPEDIMFNSGVMLIDLKKWKGNQIEDKLMKFILKHNGKIQQGDQGALNAVLSHETYCFEPRFNSVTIFYDFTYKEMILYRKPPKFYSSVAVKTATEEPVIIHFTTSFLSRRPWVKGCNHRYKEVWNIYKSMSPWADVPNRTYVFPIWKQIAMKVYELFPNYFSVRIAGFFQAYGRPIKNKLTK